MKVYANARTEHEHEKARETQTEQPDAFTQNVRPDAFTRTRRNFSRAESALTDHFRRNIETLNRSVVQTHIDSIAPQLSDTMMKVFDFVKDPKIRCKQDGQPTEGEATVDADE